MHTRCCSPPERWDGTWWQRSFSPTRSRASRASFSSVMLWKYCASMTFSTRSQVGDQVELLEDETDFF